MREPREMTEKLTAGVMKVVILAIVFAAVIAAMGEGVHELWNWLMPGIFHLPAIGYWQGVGLLVLSWILFGGFGWLGRPGRGARHHSRLMERWEQQVSEEDRAKLREGLRARCGNRAAPAEGSQA